MRHQRVRPHQETSYSGKIVASFDPAPAPPSDHGPADQPVAPWADRPFPINLATAFQLAGVQPIDVAVASQQIQVAASQLTQANLLWLPTIMIGPDYSRHDGQIQDVQGDVAPASKQSFMVGAGPYAVFAVSDAIFEPLAAPSGRGAMPPCKRLATTVSWPLRRRISPCSKHAATWPAPKMWLGVPTAWFSESRHSLKVWCLTSKLSARGPRPGQPTSGRIGT